MSTLPSKSDIRKLFPDYVVSIKEIETSIYIAPITTQKVPALLITAITHRTETNAGKGWAKNANQPLTLDPLYEGLQAIRAAGYNTFCGNMGLLVIPSDVIRFNINTGKYYNQHLEIAQ